MSSSAKENASPLNSATSVLGLATGGGLDAYAPRFFHSSRAYDPLKSKMPIKGKLSGFDPSGKRYGLYAPLDGPPKFAASGSGTD